MLLNEFYFRIYHKETEKLIYPNDGNLVLEFDQDDTRNIRYNKKLLSSNETLIEFWSGYNDCNGTRIYDNDVVLYNEKLYQVYYFHNIFLVANLSNWSAEHLSLDDFVKMACNENIKVFATIHDEELWNSLGEDNEWLSWE